MKALDAGISEGCFAENPWLVDRESLKVVVIDIHNNGYYLNASHLSRHARFGSVVTDSESGE